MKKAIILAAGIGQRLGDLTKETPKCLLKVDGTNTILDYALDTLQGLKFKEVIFVTGFASEKLEKYVDKKWSGAFKFKYINNPKYAEHNNIYSAYLAKDELDDDTVLFNSDVIYDPRILKNLVQTVTITRKKMSYLVVDDGKELVEEDMKVFINEDNLIKKIHKSLKIDDSYGEYIGITYLRGDEREKFIKALEDNVNKENLSVYYEDAIADILEESPVLPCSTGDLKWTEVDTPEDLEVAKSITPTFRAAVS